MDNKEKKILNSYPSFFSSKKTEALDKAFKILNEVLEEYAAKYNMSEAEINEFKQLILSSYVRRKASMYLENKVQNFSEYINGAINLAADHSFDASHINEESKLFYYKNKKHTIFHE